MSFGMNFERTPHPILPLTLRPEMMFPEAAEAYINLRTFVPLDGEMRPVRGRYIRPTTFKNYSNYLRSLALFFGKMKLQDIGLRHLRDYQQARLAGAKPFIRSRRPHQPPAPCPTKAQHVNQELCLLRTIMRRAGLWGDDLSFYYEELQEQECEIPRALTLEEEHIWLEVTSRNPRWHLVHWYSLVAFTTCMSTNELRSLRHRDVNLPAQILTVPVEGAKNRHRQRTVPLPDANILWAMEHIIRRAQNMGSIETEHYLFPFCLGHVPKPSRPMSPQGLKKPWEEVRKYTGLVNFRMYDTRHTGITRLAEAGTAIAVIMDMAGHISPRMTQHYTHVSEQGKIISVRKANLARQGAERMSFVLQRPDRQAQASNASAPRASPTLNAQSGSFSKSPAPVLQALPGVPQQPLKKWGAGNTFSSGFSLISRT